MVIFDAMPSFHFYSPESGGRDYRATLQNKYDEEKNRLGNAQVLQHPKFCLETYFTSEGKNPRTGERRANGLVDYGPAIVGVAGHPTPQADIQVVVIRRNQILTSKELLSAVFLDINSRWRRKKMTC
ncbi:hypothetical protein SprV_0200689100 [Sparganum proliferum]